MGYQVRQYSLKELRRISLPGAVIPSLFWALPVGEWEPHEVNRLWDYFTRERGSNCSDFGLLLVEDMAGRRDTMSSDMQWAGAALEQLLPQGTEQYAGLHNPPGASRHLLILSSAYPQPGWGVLIPISDGDRTNHAVSRIVDAAVDELGHDQTTTAAKSALLDAGKNFREWKSLDEARPNFDLTSALTLEVESMERIAASVKSVKLMVAGEDHIALPNALIDFINAVEKSPLPEMSESVARIRTTRKSVMTATAILAESADLVALEVEPKLSAIKRDPKSKEGILRSCENKKVSAAIRAGLKLEELGPTEESLSLTVRADRLLQSSLATITEVLETLESSVQGKLANAQSLLDVRQVELQRAQGEWRKRSMEAREKFHRSIAQAAEIQWRFGPRVLMAFESAAISSKFPPVSIPWDPARMIGWKLQVKKVPLTLYDLQHAAKELGLETSITEEQRDKEADTLIDGSYFTDYIHYISVSKPGDSPRTVTHKLLASLLSPAQLLKLIDGRPDDFGREHADDRQTLANSALSRMGWKEESAQRKIPLAEWSNSLKCNPDAPLTAGTAVDVRKSVENLCKDILDVITHQLGYKEAELWEALRERAPNYNPASHRCNWVEEVDNLTSGSASRLISALAPLAFPDMESEIEKCVATLNRLTLRLNEPTHDRQARDSLPEPEPLADELDCLLMNCKAVLRELPWHLSPSFVHGDQPKVICGEAWSHSHPVRRMLRVIADFDHPPRQELVLWNPSGINPVIADPVFLQRTTSSV